MWKATNNDRRSEGPQRTPSNGLLWNLWHGCHKKSEGCLHCYVFRRDAEFEKDTNTVAKTSTFNLPVRRSRQGEWKVPSGTLMWTCFTSDFFIEEADEWREEAWLMMRGRSDLYFYMVTKRPERIRQCLPTLQTDGGTVSQGWPLIHYSAKPANASSPQGEHQLSFTIKMTIPCYDSSGTMRHCRSAVGTRPHDRTARGHRCLCAFHG